MDFLHLTLQRHLKKPAKIDRHVFQGVSQRHLNLPVHI